MLITQPGVQNPHCDPLSTAMRYCVGLSAVVTLPRPSTVVTAMPSTEHSGRRHELTATCSTAPSRSLHRASVTVQAPHPPCPQAFFVPVKPTASDRR